MINAALSILSSQLNQHFRSNFQVTEDLVVLSNLQEQNGSAVPLVSNKLVLFLSGIEKDVVAYRREDHSGSNHTTRMQGPAPIYLNLLVMCAANFSGSNYPEALKFLSSTIAFFQGKPVLDHRNTPEMDPRLEKLILNIENLSASEMHSLWSIHSSRYQPSVLYRVRMICLETNSVVTRQINIRDIEASASL